MKFEKFAKKTGAHGKLMKGHGYSFLVSGEDAARIPDFALNFYQTAKADESMLLTKVFNIFDIDELAKVAELNRAIVLEADGSSSAIRRIFQDHSGKEVSISNEAFGLLEKQDHVYTGSIDFNEKSINYLVVIKNQDVAGVIFQETI